MYLVAYHFNDTMETVKNKVFSTFEKAQEYADKVDPQYKAFVVKSLDRKENDGRFSVIDDQGEKMGEQDVLLLFPSYDGKYEPIERGSYQYKINEDGEKVLSSVLLHSGAEIFDLPTHSARLPTENESFEVNLDDPLKSRELPLDQKVLLVFKNGDVISGQFLKDDDGGLYYRLWDETEQCSAPIRYAYIPSFSHS